jgi:hypothetical protein
MVSADLDDGMARPEIRHRSHRVATETAEPGAVSGWNGSVGVEMAVGALKSLGNWAEALSGSESAVLKMLNPTNHIRPADGGAFSLPSKILFPPPPYVFFSVAGISGWSAAPCGHC